MVSIISFILGLIILGILYKNMIAWEGDYRISRGQALLPVLLGLLSVPLSFIFFLIIGLVFRAVTGVVPTEGLFVPMKTSGSSYINTGEDGLQILITYFVIAAINVVLTFIVWKRVGKTIDFEKIRREW